MGTSWWAIGEEAFKAVILSLEAHLYIPSAPTANGVNGIMAINPAMENTNILDSLDHVYMNETYQTLTGAYPWSA